MAQHQSDFPESMQLVASICSTDKDFPWSDEVCQQIRARRAAMSSKLFFDILLELGGVSEPAELYPPTNISRLSRLVEAILAAFPSDSMKRDLLVYFLHKQRQDGREVGFLNERVISPFFAALMDAYWELDSGINLEGAISKIADARIGKEHTTKIIETLALDSNSAFLIRKFVRTCRPPLKEQSDLERYIIACADLNMVEAWKYQRTFPESFPGRKALVRRLLEWTLTPKPKSTAIKQLLTLPFKRYEEAVLQDFALHPPQALSQQSIEAARSLVCVRLLESSRYAAALRFDRQYPSSPAAPRGTWGAERGRIDKEVLSIMPRAERDRLENEINALDADARIRNSMGAGASMSQSWASSSFGTSGSTDLGASWEELGHRTTTAPRKSYGGGRVRTSLANESPARPGPSFAQGASAASPLSGRPLSDQPTLSSQNGAVPTVANSSPHKASPFAGIRNSPASAARLHAQKSPPSPKVSKAKVNGVPNSSPKVSSARIRNAFYETSESRSPSPSPVPLAGQRSEPAVTTSPKKGQASPMRLPTPPQEEAEKREQGRGEDGREDEHEEEASSVSEDNAGDETIIVESTGPRFSIFGRGSVTPAAARSPAPATRLTPSSGREGSPGTRRKFEGEGTDRQPKKPRVSLPGAFVSDADIDDDHEPEHELPSPTSATIEKPQTRASLRRTPSRVLPTRSSRKRSASPDDTAEFNNTRISIPGTLFEEDEDEYTGRANGHTNVPHARQNGRANINDNEDSEEADEIAPLPKHRNTRKKDTFSFIASNTLRTPRRSTRSVRGSSAEPDERLAPPSTGRPVRRSSRLQSTSPTTEHVGFDLRGKKEKEKDVRPRKATRTTGAGATATGSRASSSRR